LGSFLITEVAQFFGNFFHGNGYVLVWQLFGWATFWPIFSQTHLVTLCNQWKARKLRCYLQLVLLTKKMDSKVESLYLEYSENHYPGANPAIVNCSANATSSLMRFKNKNSFFCFE
jgi:hypothetical protein